MLGRRRPTAGSGGPRRVVFLSPDVGTAYAEFAAQVRRAGYRTVLATDVRPGWRRATQRAVDRLVFDEIWPAVEVRDGDLGVSDEVCAAVLARPTADVVSDDLVGWQLAAYLDRVRPPSDVSMLDPAWYDKRVLADRLRDLGVPGPQVWDDPGEAPLPVVVKGRLTTAGQHVRLCTSAEAVAVTLGELTGPAGPAFLQELVPGPVFSTTGVARDGQVLLSETFVQTKPPGEPTAPARHVEIVHRPDLDEVVARVVAPTGRTGIFETEQLVDSHGVPRLIDLNPRLPGNWAALHSMGSALFDTYLAVLDGRVVTGAPRLPAGRRGTSLRVTYNPPWTSREEFFAWRRYTGSEMRRRRRTHGPAFTLWAEATRERLVAAIAYRQLREKRGS